MKNMVEDDMASDSGWDLLQLSVNLLNWLLCKISCA